MKQYIVIVGWTPANRLAKFADFDELPEAEDHVNGYDIEHPAIEAVEAVEAVEEDEELEIEAVEAVEGVEGVEAWIERIPGHGGFVVGKPSDNTHDWLIDPVAETVSIDVLPPDPGPTNDEIYDQVMQNQKTLKAFVKCVNTGAIVPGANVSNAALKAAVVSEM